MDPDLSGSGLAGTCATKKVKTWLPYCRVSYNSSLAVMYVNRCHGEMEDMEMEMGDERLHSTPASWNVLSYSGHTMLFSTFTFPGNLLQRTRRPKWMNIKQNMLLKCQNKPIGRCACKWQKRQNQTASCNKLHTFNHADVVGSVTDCKRDRLFIALDELNDLCFLQRSNSTTDDSLTHAARLQQQLLHVLLQCVFLPYTSPHKSRLTGCCTADAREQTHSESSSSSSTNSLRWHKVNSDC